MTYEEKVENHENRTSSKTSKKEGGKGAVSSAAQKKKTDAAVKKPTGGGGDNKKKKDINAFLADLDLKKTENNVLATFKLPFDNILDCSSNKIERTFSKEQTIPEYVVEEFESNLDSSSNGKSGKKDKDKKPAAKPQAKSEPAKGKKLKLQINNKINLFF